MDKKKLAIILLLIIVFFVVVVLFVVNKNRNSLGKDRLVGLPMENLVQTKNDSGTFKKETLGKIKTIDGNGLVVVDDKSPLKGMTKDGASPEVSLKTTNATSVVFIKKENARESRLLSDLRVGDLVRVDYNDLTKEVAVINVSIGGADLNNLGK